MSRRETSAVRKAAAEADSGRTTINRGSLYEGRILVAQAEGFEPRTHGSAGTGAIGAPSGARPVTPPGRASAMASPGLMVLTAVAVMQGYRQLHVIPSAHLRLSQYAFAVCAPLVAVLLARSRRAWRRTLVQRGLLIVAVAIGVATPLVLAGARPEAGPVLGIGDMAVAAVALWAVLAGERGIRWSPLDPGTLEDREAPQAGPHRR